MNNDVSYHCPQCDKEVLTHISKEDMKCLTCGNEFENKNVICRQFKGEKK